MAATAYELLAFGLFAAITLGSSIGVVLVRDVWHAALLLGVALLSVAVHFVMLRAEFVAAMQILVYVGGVLVLVSFAIMLIRRDIDPGAETYPEFPIRLQLVRGLGAVALFIVLVAAILQASFETPAGFTADGSITASIGYAIIGLENLASHPTESFLAALIMIAVLLDAALDASVMLARRDQEEQPRASVTDGGQALSNDAQEDG